MSADLDYLKQIGSSLPMKQADGTVKELHLGGACQEANNALSKFFDALFGPDEVDAFDASCNTCRHFERKPMTPEEKAERNLFGMPGRCAIKNIAVRGWQRGIFCGFENNLCYENRRTGMRPAEACVRLGNSPGEFDY